jgi:hypothetical protein
MGRQFGLSGKPCVCCHGTRQSTRSGDHVFARQFFAEERRDNLPKVPACQECNNEKSKLEHYLTSVLPCQGRHEDADVARRMAESRLAENKRLAREIEDGREETMMRVAPGATRPITTVPFDGDSLLSYFRFVAKGLLWHHWGIVLGKAHDVFAGLIAIESEKAFASYSAGIAGPQVREDLGSGTFRYEGMRDTKYPVRSIWRFTIHEGVVMSARGGEADQPVRTMMAITGKREDVQQLNGRLRR